MTDKPAADLLAKKLDSHPLSPVDAVPMVVKAVLGSTQLPVSDILKLTQGSIIELDRRLGEPIDLFVEDRLVARCALHEIDDKVMLRITEILEPGDTA